MAPEIGAGEDERELSGLRNVKILVTGFSNT